MSVAMYHRCPTDLSISSSANTQSGPKIRSAGKWVESRETAFDQNSKSFNSRSTECWIIGSGDPELVNWANFSYASGGSPRSNQAQG